MTTTPKPSDAAIARAFWAVAECSYARDGVGRSLFDGVRKRAAAIDAEQPQGEQPAQQGSGVVTEPRSQIEQPPVPVGAAGLGAESPSGSGNGFHQGVPTELLQDVWVVLNMVDANQRVRDGEDRKAWDGKFVSAEVRRVIGLLDAVLAASPAPAAVHGINAKRFGDMGTGCLRLIPQEDGDMGICIVGDDGTMADVEFCVPGIGGGRSTHTLAALRALSHAMTLDNKERPITAPAGPEQSSAVAPAAVPESESVSLWKPEYDAYTLGSRKWFVRRWNGHRWEYLMKMVCRMSSGGARIRRFYTKATAQQAADRANEAAAPAQEGKPS